MDSEVISKHVATLRSEDVKGWRLSLLDNFGRRLYTSPVVPEPITVVVNHDIKAMEIDVEGHGLVQPDYVAGGTLEVRGSGLLVPHLEFGHIGLEVWTTHDQGTIPPHHDNLKKRLLRWWTFPSAFRGKMSQNSRWGKGPDGDLPIEADSMWQMVVTESRPEFEQTK